MLTKIAYFGIASVILSLCTAQYSEEFERLNNLVNTTMPLESLQILSRFRCQLDLHTATRNAEGFAPFTPVFFRCPRMRSERIPTVLCDRDCTDPVSCKVMPRFQNVPVLYQFHLRPHDGPLVAIYLPVACQCTPREGTRGLRWCQEPQGSGMGGEGDACLIDM